MKDMEDILDDVTDEELDVMIEDITEQLGVLMSMAGIGHVFEGKLTPVPAMIGDTLH